MPTYEYYCVNCDHRLEAFQKISDEPLKKCPNCQKESLQRAIGGKEAHFQFKSKGFYETDYKKNSPCSSCKEGLCKEKK
jgi:putative FmdB family regulatory protein